MNSIQRLNHILDLARAANEHELVRKLYQVRNMHGPIKTLEIILHELGIHSRYGKGKRITHKFDRIAVLTTFEVDGKHFIAAVCEPI